MTGMPARTSVSMIRALRTPPSTLTAWAPASRRKRPAFSSASSGVAYERNGMSPTTSARLRAADDGLRVVEHLGHRDADRRLVAEHAPGRANRRRAASGCRPRRGSARSGSRRRSASGCARRRRSSLAMSTTVRRRGVSVGGAHAGSRRARFVATVCAAASRASSAAATRSRMPVGDLALGQQRQVVARPVGGQDRDAVRVGAEAGAGLRDVVGDEQVHALAAQLVGGAVERAGLGREARRGPGARVAVGAVASSRGDPATSASRSGVGSSSRVSAVAAVELVVRRAAPAGSRRRRRP